MQKGKKRKEHAVSQDRKRQKAIYEVREEKLFERKGEKKVLVATMKVESCGSSKSQAENAHNEMSVRL